MEELAAQLQLVSAASILHGLQAVKVKAHMRV
jgi:hypothetical protein